MHKEGAPNATSRIAPRRPTVGLILACLATSLTLVAAGCSDATPIGPGPVGSVGPVGPVGPVGNAEEGIPGSGTITSEQREVTEFEELVFRSEGTVVLTQTTAPSLTIEADDNLHQYLTVDVSDGVMVIATTPDTDIAPSESIVFRVGVTNPAGIELAGAGSITADTLEVGAIGIVLSGTGEIFVDWLRADDLTIEHNGVGDIRIIGEAGHQIVNVSGVGAYDGAGLMCSRATVDVSGTIEATIHVTDELSVVASESGTLAYHGSPQIEQDVTGLAEVTSLGDK